MNEAPITVERSDTLEMVLFKVLTTLERAKKMPFADFVQIEGLRDYPDAGEILDSAAADGLIYVDEESGFVAINEFGIAVANDIRQSIEG